MSRLIRLTLTLVIVLAALPVLPAMAETPPLPPLTCMGDDVTGTQKSGAAYWICMPPGIWNGDLVVFAHGYVPDLGQAVAIPSDQLYLKDQVTGQLVAYLPDLITGMGYAFAVTSYSANGLAVTEGVADVRDLVRVFKLTVGPANVKHVYLVGASEGGLVTTLAVEKFPDVFSGGLAACGPVGDLRGQINYWGDFRVVFDVLFPGALPLWSAQNATISGTVMAGWETVYMPNIAGQLLVNYPTTLQLLAVAKAPILGDPFLDVQTALGILWYNVFATNDGMAKLRGQPFDNIGRVYDGPVLDGAVQRFTADRLPLNLINSHYQTSGMLQVPLVTIHNSLDPIVPAWHETRYAQKVAANGASALLTQIPASQAYGHCNFTFADLMLAFGTMKFVVTGSY